MNQQHYVSGRVVVVTGGTGSIGKAVCGALAAQGAIVVDASVDSPGTGAAAAAPGEISHCATDVGDPQSVERLFHWLDRHFPPPAVLINNAGLFAFQPLAEISPDTWRATMRVNLDGAFYCTQACLQRMLPHQQGQVINIGSVAGQTPLRGNGAYGTAKAALKMLTELVNLEYATAGIRATYVALGAVESDMAGALPPSGEKLSPEAVATALLQVIQHNATQRLESVTLLPEYRFTP